jgi:hypothetical protein
MDDFVFDPAHLQDPGLAEIFADSLTITPEKVESLIAADAAERPDSTSDLDGEDAWSSQSYQPFEDESDGPRATLRVAGPRPIK